MATIEMWMNEAVTELPGASEEGLKQAIRRTFREFCVESGAFILEQEVPISVVADQPQYDLADAFPTLLTAGYVQPMYVWSVGVFSDYANDPHHVNFLPPLQAPHYRNRSMTPGETPQGYKTFIDQPGIIELVPTVTVNITDALSCFVAFRLNRETFPDADIPSVFEYNWFDILLDGIIGTMCAQQDKPYTSITKAKIHQQRYILGKARAREMARRQFSSVDAASMFPRESGWIS